MESSLFQSVFYRVSSDLENLEMSGNFDARRKSQGILLREIDFQPS